MRDPPGRGPGSGPERPADPRWSFAAASRSPTGRHASCAGPASRRVVADDFRPTRSMRRVADANADIVGEKRAPIRRRSSIGVPRLPRHPPSRRRHGRHDRADYATTVEDSHVKPRWWSTASAVRQFDQRREQRRAACRGADRRAEATGIDASSRSFDPEASTCSAGTYISSITSSAPAGWGRATSTSGTGCAARASRDYKGRFVPQERRCRTAGADYAVAAMPVVLDRPLSTSLWPGSSGHPRLFRRQDVDCPRQARA